jgi:alpha-2-macroglobulin
MKRASPPWIRLSITLAVGLVSCFHTVAPQVPPSARLSLSEAASGPHGRAPFAVAAAGPRGVIDTEHDPGITFVFNRAMREFGTGVLSGLPAATISTEDGRPVKGHFRWVGTHGMLFQPQGSLSGATRYIVKVPRGTRALDNSVLANDYVLEFSTVRPRLLTTFPGAGTAQARADDPIFLKFSQAIDPAQLQKMLSVSVVVEGQKTGRVLPVTTKQGSPQWAAIWDAPNEAVAYDKVHETNDPSGRWLAIVPTQPWPLDSKLQIRIAKGLRSVQGPLGTEEPINVTLSTFGPLRLVDLRCARQTLGRCQAHRDFTAVLSNPVHPAEFRRTLRISGPSRPAKPNKKASRSLPHAQREHPLLLDPVAGDRFKITLRAGMTDLFGQKLAKDVSLDMTMEEPFVMRTVATTKVQRGPCVEGDSDSEDESTVRVPGVVKRRPILDYGLEVGVRGHILEALSGPGGSAGPSAYKIPVSAVNVPTYGLYTEALTESVLVQRLTSSTTHESFAPSDVTWNWVTPAVPSNTRAVKLLDMRSMLNGANKGTAYIGLAALGMGAPYHQNTLNVTDLGITARISRLGSLVWVTHLATGTPAARATVSVHDKKGDIVCAGQTDERGLLAFSAKELKPIQRSGGIESSLLFVARLGDDYTYQRLEQANGLYNGPIDYLQMGQWVGLVFTDRGVYRPGETVKVGGYFRRTAETGFKVLPGQEYQYIIQDTSNETIAAGESKLDAYGAMAADVVLAKSAALGHATLTVRLGRRGDEQFSAGFEILAYKPAEFKVNVEPLEREAVHRQSATFTVNSEYLFGAPVTEARVEQYVTRTETSFAPPNSATYIVDDTAYQTDLHFITQRGTAYSQATGELDKNGRLSRTIELDAPEQSKPEQLTFEAEVQDLTQQTQAGRANVLVHPAQFYLGLKQPNKRFLAIGAEMPSDVVALTPKGVRQQNVPITLQLYKRIWTSVVEDRASDALHYQTHLRDEDAGHCSVTSSSQPVICHLRLAEPGYYILRASAKDSLGNPVHASIGVYAVDDRADEYATPIGWEQPDRKALALELDQKKYQPGDTARILVKSPFKEATALVTVERGSVHDQMVVPLRGTMPVVDIPIKDEYFPNVFVSVHMLRGRIAPRPEPGAADVGAPDYRVGYASLRVDPESRRLKVDVSATRKEYRPGEQVQAKVALHRLDGAPSAGTVTFYVVDEGVLMLTGYKTPDPLPAFSEPRALGVFPVESREHLAQILRLRNGEHIPILGYEVAAGSDKGNEVGGSGAEEMPGHMRSDFRTTVYFKAGHAVGNDGQATFHFKLPDNLTSFRLMAVAAGAEDRYGFGEGTITTNRRLMARPAMPRTLRVGDALNAGVIVTSKGLGQSVVDVALNAKGVVPTGPTKQQVALPKNGQVEVRFPVKIAAEGDATFEFSARAGTELDQVRVTRKIEQPKHWLTAAAYGATDKSASVALGDLKGLRKDMGELTVTLSSSALVGLGPVFEELSTYPYGCTEQLASRMLPVLAAPKLAEQQQFRMPAKTADAIDEALSAIAKRQRHDGSFGYWEDDTEGHVWLTAYTFLALEHASKAGYFVPKRIRDTAANFLLTRLDVLTGTPSPDNAEPSDDADGEFSDDKPKAAPVEESFAAKSLSPREKTRVSIAEASFIAEILARVGHLDEARIYKLVARKPEMALSSKIQLLAAMAQTRLPRQELNQLLAEVLQQVTVGPAEARVEATDPLLSDLLESPTRSTAILLQAVLAIDAKSPLAVKLARGLVKLRTGTSYRNTQEDAWALLALEDYRKAVEAETPNFGAEVFFADNQVGEFAFRGLPVHSETAKIPADILIQHPSANVAVRVIDQGVVNYAMQLRMAKDGASYAAIDEGFSVEKLARAIEPAALKKASASIPENSESYAGLGQLVLVDVLLETPEPRDQIVLDDRLPSGLEPVDFSFETTAMALSAAENEKASRRSNEAPASSRYGKMTQMRNVHREMHDDHVLYFIPHLDAGIFHFRYLARATTPGVFIAPPTRASCMYDTEIFGQSSSADFEVGLTRYAGPLLRH